MEIEEDDFKSKIIPKIKKSTQDLVNNKHSRVLISDFNSIQRKKVGNYFTFYNKVYNNVSKFFLINNTIIYIFYLSIETFRIFQ
jgi:hypothetical protein